MSSGVRPSASASAAERGGSLSDRHLWIVALVVLLAVYLPTATYGPRQIIDTAMTAVQSWTIAERGHPYVDDLDRMFFVVETPGGGVTNRLPGPVLWGLPFYGLRAAIGSPVEATSSLEVPLWPAGVAGALATAIGLSSLAVGLRRAFGWGGVVGAFVLAFGSPTWGVSANALWTHSITQLGLGLAVLGLTSARPWAAGSGFAVAIMARPHVAIIAAVVGLWSAARERTLATVVPLAASSVAGLLGVGWYSWQLADRFSVTGLYGGRIARAVAATGLTPSVADSSPLSWVGGLALMMVSPQRGLLFSAPVVLVLIPLLRTAWRRAPTWARSLAVGGALQLVAQAAAQPIWTGGDAFFGSRLTLEALTAATPLLTIAGMEAWQRAPSWRRLLLFGIGLSLILNLLGATVLTLGVWR